MIEHSGSSGNFEGYRVTRVVKDSNGKIIKRTRLHQVAQPTYEQFIDAEMQLKKWAWVQTEIIMKEMELASPEELEAMEWDEEEQRADLMMRLYNEEKELGD